MQNIVINESYLRKLQAIYTDLVDDIDRIYGKIYPYGHLPESRVDFTKPFTLRLGGAGFSEAVELVERIDTTRSGLAARFKSGRGELSTLEHGIRFLLADSEATEQVSTLSAEQFEHFMPKVS
ncbi:hypothetical protein GCM10027280_06640 [Micromonospora polyrhachis]|uniref:Uncharacterized protein n=1 Tax=Micromonospora polyrhachis TaxID=1282883 RepID=A0A7W7SKE8_9ACTN|nr:hypothetical protein [Micromonospora polyrhachis]MBB4956425.1 hypothetical protein [Micromonospora polyrhachis]